MRNKAEHKNNYMLHWKGGDSRQGLDEGQPNKESPQVSASSRRY